VRVRDRLINERDELFGLTPQSYKTWNPFRTVFHADDLDAEITASRESVEESEAVAQVREIAAVVFVEAIGPAMKPGNPRRFKLNEAKRKRAATL
jgi:hypothetical protein